MKAIFLFPGQGAQYRGMALDLWEKSESVRVLFELAADSMGSGVNNIKNVLATADDEMLKRTDVSQPLITLVNLAAAAYLAERGVNPVACAGFSLGEYAALASAGVITAEDCFRLVDARGRAMQEAVNRINQRKNAPGMAAVLGIDSMQVEVFIAEWNIPGLFAANFNAKRQTVVSGTAEALAEAETRFKSAGARRFVRLAVAGPFHSPLINEAAARFAPVLEKTTFKNPAIPLFSNVTGNRVKTGVEAKQLALAQIASPVRWTREEASLAASVTFDAVLETGPGSVLANLWKDTGNTIPCFAAGTAETIEHLTALNAVDG
jgi:[acyl-carrier-protein] S-malonyltransferase